MKKKRQKSKLVLIITIIFCFVIIVTGIVIRTWQFEKKSSWNGKSHFIVFDAQRLSLLVFFPEKREYTEFLLPDNAYVTVGEGYGTYKLKDVRALAQVEGKKEIITQAVSNTYGIPINTTIDRLTKIDLLRIFVAKKTYVNRDTVIDLSTEDITRTEKRIDGEEIEIIDLQKIDQFFEHRLVDKTIVEENLAVGVFNASNQPGIAGTIARKLSKIGIRVVEMANWNNTIEGDCMILSQLSALQSNTLLWLSNTYQCSVSEESPGSRFDIVIATKNVL